MTLLHHYLQAVRMYLPRGARQEDIIQELGELLGEKLEDREAEMGRPLTELEQQAVLSEHGAPVVVADRYGATNRGLSFGRQLISPELFPLYLRLFLFQMAVTAAILAGLALFTGHEISLTLALVSVMGQFVLLTTVFTVIDALRRMRSPFVLIGFPPAYLQPVPRWQSLSGMTVLAVVALWWIGQRFMPSLVLLGAADVVEFTGGWRVFFWPVLLILGIGISQRVATLIQPEWNWLQAISRLAVNVSLLILVIPFLDNYPYVAVSSQTPDPAADLLALRINNGMWGNVLYTLSIYWLITAAYHVWLCATIVRYASRVRRERVKRVSMRVVACLGFLCLAVPGFAQNPAPASEGARLYLEHCTQCHDRGVPGAVPRAALTRMPANTILAALTTGPMRTVGETITANQRAAIALFLGSAVPPESPTVSSFRCTSQGQPFGVAGQPAWSGWGVGPEQLRFQPAAHARLTAAQVPSLRLKWAFAFPLAAQAYSQPAIVAGRVFVGSFNRKVYSLDAATGCEYWSFDAEGPVRTALSVGEHGGRWMVFFGDQGGMAYGVDANTGALVWKTLVDDHPTAAITGAPVLAGNKLLVPMSSAESGLAAQPTYQCCTFRGSISALDAATGRRLWTSYTIAEEPRPGRVNARKMQNMGPSGAAVWSAPVVDTPRNRVYVVTGNGYSDPVANTSDAFLAFDLDTGARLWTRQITANDGFTVDCDFGPFKSNCPDANGPDFDLVSPLLVTLPSGRRALIAGQKSGQVHAVDPDRDGAVLWEQRVGQGSRLGGVHWGIASDGRHVFVANSDVQLMPATQDTPGAQPFAGIGYFAFNPEGGGGLYALDVETGRVAWRTPHPGCNGRPGCTQAQSAAVTIIPGVVFSGGLDGQIRAYASDTGRIIWDYDTNQDFKAVNGVRARGGSIDGPGVVVVDGVVYVSSGYAFAGGAPGNVLLAFSVDGR